MHKNRFLKDEKSFFFGNSLSVIHFKITKTAALALEPQMLASKCRSNVWLWRHLQVDFWSPENAEQVTIDMEVDMHVPAMYLSLVHTLLQQSDMEHK